MSNERIKMDTGKSAKWTDADLNKLLSQMRKNIKKRDLNRKYSKGLTRLDWDKVAFHPHSSEACRKKWDEILQRSRKIRTLTEIIDDAESAFEDPFTGKNYRLHPEFPKKPVGPNVAFSKDNISKIKRRYPNLSFGELSKIVSDAYRKLSDDKKAEYVEKYQCAKEEYEKKMRKLRKRYPKFENTWIGRAKKSAKANLDGSVGVAQKGLKKPPGSGFSLFAKEKKDYLKHTSPANTSRRCDRKAARSLWEKLTVTEKEVYKKRCKELKKAYKAKVKQRASGSSSRASKKKSTDEKPVGSGRCRTGYTLFCKEQRAHMTDFYNMPDFLLSCGQRWRTLTDTQKDEYKKRCKELQKEYDAKLDEQGSASTNGEKPRGRFHDEPKKPVVMANAVFCQEQMERLKRENPGSKHRMASVCLLWRELSEAEKDLYKAKAQENKRRYIVELQEWFIRLPPDEQADYWIENPRKREFLKECEKKIKMTEREERAQRSRQSDSEDEVFEVISTEEESDFVEDEDEEEEDQHSMTFGMMDVENLFDIITIGSGSELESDV